MWTLPFCPEPPEWHLDWQGILDAFPWLEPLGDCPQDPIFHPEGNVLVHTQLVCESLASLDAWRDLEPVDRSVVFAAALMHDIAKPACTREEDGRIVSPKHAIKGAQWVRRWLWQVAGLGGTLVGYRIRESIVALIRHHGLPLRFWERPDPTRSVIQASFAARCDQLAILAQADVLGRTAADRAELLEVVDAFRDFATEQHCLSGPREFPSAHSRVLYCRNALEQPGIDLYDDTWGEVVILSGLPGAGKDTWIRESGDDWPVVSLDVLRAEMQIAPEENQGRVVARAREEARRLLRRQQRFIWNATNISRQLRHQTIGLCLDYKARVRIVYVEASWSDLLARNRKRTNRVPEKVLERLLDKLDPPDLTEAHQLDECLA